MDIPGSLSERFPFLDVLEEDWEPVLRAVFIGWMIFYVILIGNALLGGHLFNWFDLVFIPIHEGGHLLFRFFGEWVMVAGGTFLQLFVPFALAVYFAFRRQVPGTAFCAFFFFEQFLPIGIYMADARAQALPLQPWEIRMTSSTTGFTCFRTRGCWITISRSAVRFVFWAGWECLARLSGLRADRCRKIDVVRREIT